MILYMLFFSYSQPVTFIETWQYIECSYNLYQQCTYITSQIYIIGYYCSSIVATLYDLSMMCMNFL